MSFKIIAVGKIKDQSLFSKADDYSGRILKNEKLELIEIRDSTIEEEGEKILELLEKEKNSHVFALAEEGKQYSSGDFSAKIKQFGFSGKKAVFIIGGPSGMSQSVKQKANELLSLSKMTLPHELCRVFLLEQIYRAISIIKNLPYHK